MFFQWLAFGWSLDLQATWNRDRHFRVFLLILRMCVCVYVGWHAVNYKKKWIYDWTVITNNNISHSHHRPLLVEETMLTICTIYSYSTASFRFYGTQHLFTGKQTKQVLVVQVMLISSRFFKKQLEQRSSSTAYDSYGHRKQVRSANQMSSNVSQVLVKQHCDWVCLSNINNYYPLVN